jgi:RNA polymerase sigma factor (sigma-70 family)
MQDSQVNSASIDVEKLFRTHQKHVLLFVRRYVRDPFEAEDVVQSTFLEATRCAANFSSLSKPSTWLFGIALNMARNHVRRGKNEVVICDGEDYEDACDPLADPAAMLESRELAIKSMALINSMSDELRSTFNAVLNCGQTYDLAARELGIPVGTVRSRLSRIREQLRNLNQNQPLFQRH